MDRRWWTLVAVLAGTFMLLLDLTIVVVALPAIQQRFTAGFDEVEWIVNAYALSLASFLLTTGALADRYGRRRLFAIGLLIFTLGSLGCGFSQSPLELIGARALQGVGGATMFATSLALLAQDFTGHERGVAFGAWGAVSGAAAACGPILGGLITSGISWRGIFLVNVPVGIAALVVTLARVGESRAPRTGRLDWPGFVVLTGGLVTLVYGLTLAGEEAWTSPAVLGCLTGGAVLLVGFGRTSPRARTRCSTSACSRSRPSSAGRSRPSR